MMAIFHGTSWLNFLERTRLFGFYSTAGRDWKKEMGAFTLPEAFAGKWCYIQRFVSVGVTLGFISFATEIVTITKAFL